MTPLHPSPLRPAHRLRAWARALLLGLAFTGSGIAHAHAADAPAPQRAEPAPRGRLQPGASDAAPAAGAAAVDYAADVPPPTAYDRLEAQPGIALAPENLGLFRQLGRTVLALSAVLALLYLFFKLLMPKLVERVAPKGGRELRVRERLALDGKNSVVVLEHQDGRSWLLGCSDGGMVHLASTPAPQPGPLPARRDAAAGDNFAAALHRPHPDGQADGS